MNIWKLGLAVLIIIAVAGVAFAAPIRIGTKNFTEQFLVGNLMAIFLEEHGYEVELHTGMSSTVMREAMENGDLDLCMEYTGTQWLNYTGHEFKGESPEEMYDKVKVDDAERGLVWLLPIWCNNTYAMAVTREFAEQNSVYTLSDFASYVNDHEGAVPFACTSEFYTRPNGIQYLQEHYGFTWQSDYITYVLPGRTHEYLAEGRSTAAMVFGTDPIVVKYDWVVLQDDKNFWPPYDLVPVVRSDVLETDPSLEEVLNELIVAFPQDPVWARAEMACWNAQVDIELKEPKEAAEDFLWWIKSKRTCTQSDTWSDPTHRVNLNSYTDELRTWIGTYRTTQYGYMVYNSISPRVTIDKVTIDFGAVVKPDKKQTVPAGFIAGWGISAAGTTIVTYTARAGAGIAVGKGNGRYFAFSTIRKGTVIRAAVSVEWGSRPAAVTVSGNLRACVPR